MMRSVIITCHNIKAEVDQALRETSCNYPVLYLDSTLHDQPELLKKALQKELDHISNAEQVILAMGYCGNVILGLKANNFRIVVPRVDDCMTLFLGSQKRRKEVMDEAATYFFTKGWLDAERNILSDHLKIVNKYGEEKANMVLNMMFQHYGRIGLIDTGVFDLEPQIYKTERIAKTLKLKFEIIPGTMGLLKKLLMGPYDADFIVVKP